jgi:hypothetical protein
MPGTHTWTAIQSRPGPTVEFSKKLLDPRVDGCKIERRQGVAGDTNLTTVIRSGK